MSPLSYARHQFPPAIIQHAIWLYLRFTLSHQDVEELLAVRGIEVSYETVRRWVVKFGPAIASNLRRLRPKPSPRWHLDEMVVRTGGQPMSLNPDARPGEATIRIRRSKADQEGQGAEAWLSSDAVAALTAWRAMAPQWPTEPGGEGPLTREGTYLFCHLSHSGAGERMSPAAVRRVVERRTGEANLLAVGFSGHSLRAGAA